MTQQGEMPKKKSGNDNDNKTRVETTDDDDKDETGWTVVSYRRRNARNNHQIEKPMTTGELTSQSEETTVEATETPTIQAEESDTPSGNTEYGQNTSEPTQLEIDEQDNIRREERPRWTRRKPAWLEHYQR